MTTGEATGRAGEDSQALVLEDVTGVPARVFERLPTVAQAAVVARVVPERVRTLDVEAAEAVVAVTQQAINALAGLRDVAVAACVRAEELRWAELDGEWVPGETYRPDAIQIVASSLAPMLGMTPRAMQARVEHAVTVVDELPETLSAALSGRMGERQVAVVARRAELVDVDARAIFDRMLHADPGVSELPPGRLARACERAALRADPDAAEKAVVRAIADRFVRVAPDVEPGMAFWSASLGSLESARAWAAIDELAHEYLRADMAGHPDVACAPDPVEPTGGDDGVARPEGVCAMPGVVGITAARTIDQARADAMLDLLLGNATVTTSVELVVPTFTDIAEPGRPSTEPSGEIARERSLKPADTPRDMIGRPASPDEALTASLEPETATGTTLTGQAPRSLGGGAREAGASVDAGAAVVEPRCGGHETPAPEWLEELEVTAGPAIGGRSAIGSELFGHGHPDLDGLPEAAAVKWLVLLQHEETARARDESARGLLERHGIRFASWRPPEFGVRDPRVGWLLTRALLDVLTDPDVVMRLTRADPVSGVTVGRDPHRYRPHAALARHVRDRDRTCRFPGCGVAARRCDLDHVIPYPDGETNEDNLVCLCRTHHGFKHHAGWTLTLDARATCLWRSPTGRVYFTRPADVRLDAA
jgi:hypothetical protein